jgi:hypothetical protein
MAANQNGRGQLLQAAKKELRFFDARGYGYPFRSEWRPTLLLRDSPVCINFSSAGQQHACRECPLFSLVPVAGRGTLIPCHNIPLDVTAATISDLYRKGTQQALDQPYREWLCNLIQELEQP